MAKVKAQSTKSAQVQKTNKQISDEVCARIAFHYPAYTLAAARKLPYKDVIILDNNIEREQGRFYNVMLQIVTAPNTKDTKKSVTKLVDYFKQMMRS